MSALPTLYVVHVDYLGMIELHTVVVVKETPRLYKLASRSGLGFGCSSQVDKERYAQTEVDAWRQFRDEEIKSKARLDERVSKATSHIRAADARIAELEGDRS